MAVHTEFRKGQRVFVKMKTGVQIIDKYCGKKRGKILLENYKLDLKDIRFVSINK